MQKLMEEIIVNTKGLLEYSVPFQAGLSDQELIDFRNTIPTKIPFAISIDGMKFAEEQSGIVCGLKFQFDKILVLMKENKRKASKGVNKRKAKGPDTKPGGQYPEGHVYHDPFYEQFKDIHSTDMTLVTAFLHGPDTAESNSR
jgi:hypothetical protein